MKKKVVISILILCFCLIILLSFVLSPKSKFIDYDSGAYGEKTDISLVSLIVDPEKYHGKAVRVSGFIHIGIESNAIFLSECDYKYGNFNNALWLDIDEKVLGTTYKELRKANGKYVTIEGNVDGYSKGHFSLYSCELDNITRLYYDT